MQYFGPLSVAQSVLMGSLASAGRIFDWGPRGYRNPFQPVVPLGCGPYSFLDAELLTGQLGESPSENIGMSLPSLQWPLAGNFAWPGIGGVDGIPYGAVPGEPGYGTTFGNTYAQDVVNNWMQTTNNNFYTNLIGGAIGGWGGGGVGVHQLLDDTTHDDTTTDAPVRGDLVSGQIGPTWGSLNIEALGADAFTVVCGDGTDIYHYHWPDNPGAVTPDMMPQTLSAAGGNITMGIEVEGGDNWIVLDTSSGSKTVFTHADPQALDACVYAPCALYLEFDAKGHFIGEDDGC